jgi:hypothetical protein
VPDWNPLQVGLFVGVLCGALWSTRTVWKQHTIAGVWMLGESRFWRSLVTGFAITFILGALISSLLAAIAWLLHGLLLRVI